MKKLVSLALSVLLSLSMSVPAFAANTVTSTESGSNTATQSVKASYTPSSGITAEITGVSVTIDGTTYTSANTSADNPAKITPTSTVTITATGTNFDKLPEEPGDYAVAFASGRDSRIYKDSEWTISENTATYSPQPSIFSGTTSAYHIRYINKYNENSWTNTGIYIIYDSGTTEKAEITGVSITIDGTTYTSANTSAENPAKIKPTSTVTITVTGTNFDKLPEAYGDYEVEYARYASQHVYKNGSGTISGNTATYSSYPNDFASTTSAFQIRYTNTNGGSWTGTGIYVIYDSGVSSENDPVITNLTLTVDGINNTRADCDAEHPIRIKPNSTVTITVEGANLDKANGQAQVKYSSSGASKAINAEWTINSTGTSASITLTGSSFSGNVVSYNIEYTYDSFSTTIPSGVYIIYEAPKAEITGVSITVGGQTYTSGTVTLTPTSGDVTIIVTGTNLNNVTTDNLVGFPSGYTWTMTGIRWTVNDAGTEIRTDLGLDRFEGCTTATEIQYTNNGQVTWTGSGVYVIYQAETVSVEVTWGALSFTYSDEAGDDGNDKGWTCDTGANTVKVENKGTVSVKADVTFTKSTSATNITNVTGTFDKSTATLAKDASETFTLTLAGKPDGALNSDTIGTITVTITKADTSAN